MRKPSHTSNLDVQGTLLLAKALNGECAPILSSEMTRVQATTSEAKTASDPKALLSGPFACVLGVIHEANGPSLARGRALTKH